MKISHVINEGMAQDEAEETNGWRAELVNQINYNTSVSYTHLTLPTNREV